MRVPGVQLGEGKAWWVMTWTDEDTEKLRSLHAENEETDLDIRDDLAEDAILQRAADEIERLQDRVKEQLDYERDVAHQVGICYCRDYGCDPGPRDTVLAEIRRLKQRVRELEERDPDPAEWVRRSELVEALRHADSLPCPVKATDEFRLAYCEGWLGAVLTLGRSIESGDFPPKGEW